jgi:malate dehydrogenase (oxaloacetate-decarboxylating)
MSETVTSDNSVRTSAEPAVLNDPLRNRGVAFTLAEREALGVIGRLPSGELTLENQARRAWQQLQAQGDDLAKNVYMEQLHDRSEVLYYRVLLDHLLGQRPVRGRGPDQDRRLYLLDHGL